MSAYVDDIKDAMKLIENGRKSYPIDYEISLRLGTNIKLVSQAICCVGEREFREYLYDKGEAIIRAVGDDEFYPVNPAPDFGLIVQTIDEVYERMKFELTSGPPAIPARS